MAGVLLGWELGGGDLVFVAESEEKTFLSPSVIGWRYLEKEQIEEGRKF